MENFTQPQSDHDTLIEIRTLVGELKKEVQEMKNGTHAQLIEHERRIRLLEDLAIRMKVYIGVAIGLGGLLGTILNQLLRVWLESHIGK